MRVARAAECSSKSHSGWPGSYNHCRIIMSARHSACDCQWFVISWPGAAERSRHSGIGTAAGTLAAEGARAGGRVEACQLSAVVTQAATVTAVAPSPYGDRHGSRGAST